MTKSTTYTKANELPAEWSSWQHGEPPESGEYIVEYEDEHGRRRVRTLIYVFAAGWMPSYDVVAWMPMPEPEAKE